MGFFKKLFNEASDSIKKSVEERKQELLKSVEDRKQEFLQNVEDRKREALAKIGLMSIDSDSNNNIDCIKSETIEKQEAKENTVDDNGVFSSRLEALISSSLQDGVLTEKEKAILKKRVEAEGEDWDEVMMIVEARLAEKQTTATVSQVSQAQVQSEVVTSVKESPHLIVNGKEYKDVSIDEIRDDLADITGLYEDQIISVIIPSSVKEIKERAFDGYKNLKELVIPSSVESFGYNYFDNHKSFEKLQINCPTIPHNTFDNAPLKEVVIGKCVKKIEDAAFLNCKKLQIVDMSQCDSLEEIGESAFLQCSSAEFALPKEFESLKSIGRRAFENCEKITSFPFSKALSFCSTSAFKGCSNLQMLDFSKCTELGDINYGIIYNNGLESLKKITLPPSQECFNALCVWGSNIHIGEKTNEVEVDISLCNFKVVRKEAFQTMDMKEIIIPDTVESIGENAFDECNNLKTIVMPAALKEIKPPLGDNMEQLKKIDFSKVRNLKTIPTKFFGSCYKLKELVIPQGVVEIEDDAFAELHNLKRLFLPPTLESIGDLEHDRLSIYCFSPLLEELEPIVYGWDDDDDDDDDLEDKKKMKINLFVLPQYLDKYIAQRNAERIPEDILVIDVIPEEYRYYYDN